MKPRACSRVRRERNAMNDHKDKTKETTEFPFPFIADHELKIAKSLDLLLSETEILPSILILNEKLDVEWAQRGRNALYFGDPELMKRLKCEGWI